MLPGPTALGELGALLRQAGQEIDTGLPPVAPTPAILLLVALAGITLADHHKKVLWRATVVSLVMLAVGVLVGAIPF